MPSGILTKQIFEIVLACAGDDEKFSVSSRRGCGSADFVFAAQVAGRDRPRSAMNSCCGAAQITSPPFSPDTDPVRRCSRLPASSAVVFDDNHGVSDVGKVAKNAGKRGGIARMQPDRRFIQHVEGPDQMSAQLVCQGNALGLSAGYGSGLSGQGQIAQSDPQKKPKLGRNWRRISLAMSCSNGVRARLSSHREPSSIVKEETWWIFLP